jgi:hypothetical protein
MHRLGDLKWALHGPADDGAQLQIRLLQVMGPAVSSLVQDSFWRCRHCFDHIFTRLCVSEVLSIKNAPMGLIA